MVRIHLWNNTALGALVGPTDGTPDDTLIGGPADDPTLDAAPLDFGGYTPAGDTGRPVNATPRDAAVPRAAATPGSAPAAGVPSASDVAISAVVTGPFISLGPSPDSGPEISIQSGDSPPNGSVAGAVQAIVTDPTDANTLWIGGPNGGVWVTHDGGATWAPLTDHQASLSIASLSLDPTDATNNTLIAGIGLTSNGTVGSLATNESFFLGNGGQRDGILYSTNGGASWSAFGGATLSGQSVVGVAARGSVLLAATFEPWAFHSGASSEQTKGGLYRSTNGGATFTQIPSTSGLPTDPTTSLVGDPANSSRLYAAITSQSNHSATAIYVSNDTGATWTEVFGAAQSSGVISASANQTIIRVATGPSGELAAAVVDVTTGTLVGLFLSQNAGTSWTSLAVPNINPGGQGVIDVAIACDPTTAGIVYVTGDDTDVSPFSATAYRVTTSGATSITGVDTANNSFPHADTRAIAFDNSGRLILGTDGGIYARTSPQSSSGAWTGLNGAGLSLFQPYRIAFDGNSDRLVIAAQDTGVSIENSPGGAAFTPLSGGDGVNAAVNDVSVPGDSVIYGSSQSLFLIRQVLDSQGNPVGPTPTLFVNLTCPTTTFNPVFSSPFVLNNIDPSRIAVGDSTDLYVTTDTTLGSLDTALSSLTLSLTDLGSYGTAYTMAYGTRDNSGALLAGTDQGLFLSTAASPTLGTPAQVTSYTGLEPTDVIFDPRTMARFYAADNANLYGTQNQGSTMQTLTPNLTALDVIRPTALAFVSNNGVNALLVGGLDTLANLQSPIVAADSDTSGNLTGWRLFGTGLPNTIVSTLSYDPKSDTLAAGLWGRGGWVMYDVTSNFSSATQLQFGLANNDSNPDASVLTGARPLVKFGTGNLTITGTASYGGGSTINAGEMRIGNGAVAGAIAGNVLNDGTLAFDQPSASIFAGTITGTGMLDLVGPGLLKLTSANGYSGGTTISADILELAAGGNAGIGAITFAAPTATLEIDAAVVNGATFADALTGFATDGTIDLTSLAFVSGATATFNGTTLTLTDGGTTADFNLSSVPAAGTKFHVGGNAAQTTVSSIACYRAGTLIATERGEVPVELLSVGDIVVTAAGERQPIRWIGRRHIDCSRHPRPDEVCPIRVRAAAFGDGLPRRDLFLSPDHAIYVDDRLIPVKWLVHGDAIAQVATAAVTYYHVELPCHDVLLAEGLPAESYLDTGDRANFANGGATTRLHPGFSARAWDALGCAPLTVIGPELAEVRRRLVARDAARGGGRCRFGRSVAG